MRESSDFDYTTDNDELENMQFIHLDKTVNRLMKSKDDVDQRFINMYRKRKAHQDGLKFGYD